VEAYGALEMALGATGYVPKSRWAYNFRGISGAICTCAVYGKCSLHGEGIAVDIDPTENPYIATSTFSWSKTKFNSEQIEAVKAIKNTDGEQMWDWGGWWNTIKDYMHFELQVGPSSCKVDWTTVKGYKKDEMLVELTDAQLNAINTMASMLASRAGDVPKWGTGMWNDYVTEVWTGPTESDPGWMNPVTHIQLAKVTNFLRGQIANLQKELDALGDGSGITVTQVDTKIADHAKLKAGTTVHPHGHDEGVTGPPI
jgi:hypothetical protein